MKTTKLHYLRRHSLLIIGVLFASLVEDACAAFYPLAMSYVIDDYSSLTPDKLGLTAGLFAVASLVLLIADYLTKLGMVRLARDVKSEIRRDLFASLLKEGGADFANHDPAYYVSLLSNDVDELYYSYYDNVVWFIRRLVEFAAFFGILAYVNWVMALAVLAATLISFFIPKLVGKKLESNQKAMSDGKAAYLERAHEILSGKALADAKSYLALEKRHEEKALEREKKVYDAKRYEAFTDIFQGASLYLVQAICFATGITLLAFGKITVGALTASMLFADLLVVPTNDALGILLLLNGGKAYEKKISDFLSIPSNPSDVSQKPIESLAVEDVSAKNGDFELKDVSFSLIRGEKLAILGKNGAGKSTLVRSILGIIPLEAGTVEIDKNDSTPSDFASRSAYIAQDVFLFDATVKDNITLFGSYPFETSSYEKMGLGKSLDYQVGKMGINLSGGEKAKLAILRALARGQSFLILDEALAAVDEKSKKDISSFLASSGLTVIAVTHDLSDDGLAIYDRAIVLKNGEEIASLSKSEMAKAGSLI